MAYGKGNMGKREEKKKKEEREETYLKLGLIKGYRKGGKHILIMLRLQKKRKQKIEIKR